MIPAHSYNSICENLFEYFNEKPKIRRRKYSDNQFTMKHILSASTFFDIEKFEQYIRKGKVKLIGILFVQPSHKISKDEVLPNLNYYHLRSGKNVNFYLAGYGAYWDNHDYPDIEVACNIDGTDWLFSSLAFNKLRLEIESKSKWCYSGECDLIITNAKIDPSKGKVFLDFSSSIAANLERLKSVGAITSVRHFFEDIFRYAENQNPNDPTWGLSDKLGINSSKSVLLNIVLRLLPKDIGKEIEKVSQFAVTDISK